MFTPVALFQMEISILKIKEDIYSIRNNISVFTKHKKKGGVKIAFLFEHSRLIHTFQVSDLACECIKLFDGTRTNTDIAQKLGLQKVEVQELCLYLNDQNILQLAHPEKVDQRYSRQLNFLSSFESALVSRYDLHERMLDATIVIVGMGSIGSWIAESLVRSGIGGITLIDCDIVDQSNLPRQALYAESDIGLKKVSAAANRLWQVNKSLNIKQIDTFVESPNDLASHIIDATVVVNCTDEPDVTTTNDIVSIACFEKCIPHVLCGGYDGHLSYIGQTVIPFKTSCWRCYSESMIYDKSLKGYKHIAVTSSKAQGGTLAPVSAIMANIHALEVIKIVTGYHASGMKNRKAEFDFLTYSLHFTDIPRNPRCTLCGARNK